MEIHPALVRPGFIWIHRVSEHGVAGFRTLPMWNAKPSVKISLSPALLRVCKQIYNEATPLLFSKNIFCFRRASDTTMFLYRFALRTRYLRVIKTEMHLTMTTSSNLEAMFNALAFAENLESLEGGLRSDRYTMDQTVQYFHLVARNWLRAVEQRKRDKRAALDVLHCDVML
ncbi:hypothetical protein BU23DRAFT_225703 [Bimuria novae-zelandiae CBS 107.79]|uniref:Uncharacterized protein n=1 Tax=Bimuria novae-zelandiae CBS 107.79 TaxID=1447943 RepID=A0A6A5VPN4_9PLEO|nr:hypothetical protein BU23DRAFT_225703 [Bimuria novae-zelandiae CBS 107.79]